LGFFEREKGEVDALKEKKKTGINNEAWRDRPSGRTKVGQQSKVPTQARRKK